MEDNRIILFNLASRSRPDRCRKVIHNTIKNCKQRRYKILLKTDADDRTQHRYMTMPLAHGWRVQSKSESKVHAINRDIPLTGWDILVNLSDDILWTKMCFDEIIRKYCGPDDFVLFPEPYAAREINKATHGLVSVVSIIGYDYYMRDKYVYHPSYLRTHCDNEATEVAKIRGCFKQVDIKLFYHEHWAAGYKVKDDLYRMEKQTWAQDEKNYLERKENNFYEVTTPNNNADLH